MKTFKEFISDCELVEGKVEWDNPKRPLQSGLTPREKNRAKRISTNVENPDRIPSERDLERYGKLKLAHEAEKGKKVSRGKRHEFNLITDWEGNQRETKGQINRRFKDHKNIKTKLNSKLYRNDERQKIYHTNDLKESK